MPPFHVHAHSHAHTTTESSGLSNLPLELLDFIFYKAHLDDSYRLSLVPLSNRRHVPLTLPTCRLVSKRWNSIATPRLFAHVVVRKGTRGDRPRSATNSHGEHRKRNGRTFQDFLAFVVSSPAAAYHIKILTLTVWTPTEVEVLLSAKTLKAILPHLPRLEELYLDSILIHPTALESEALNKAKNNTSRVKAVLKWRKSIRAYLSYLRPSSSSSSSSSATPKPKSYIAPRTSSSIFKLLLHNHRPLLPRPNFRSTTIFTLKKLSLHKVRVRQDDLDQLTAIFASFSAIDSIELSSFKVSPSPPSTLTRTSTTANISNDAIDSSLSAFVQQTILRTNHLSLKDLHIRDTSAVAIIPFLERTASFRRVRKLDVSVDLYRDAPQVALLVRSRLGIVNGGGLGSLSAGSLGSGSLGGSGGNGGGSMMKNLTELVLDFNGIPWRRSALSILEQRNAAELTRDLGFHLPNLHRFKFVGTMPPLPTSLASLSSLSSLETHSPQASFYIPTYTLPLSFISAMPINLGHLTLDVGYVPEFMWEEVTMRTKRLVRIRSLSMLVVRGGGEGKNEGVGGLERERVNWLSRDLRSRGILYIGTSSTPTPPTPSPRTPSVDGKGNGGKGEGESEGDGGKAEMVDGAPSCRQFGCVVGELGVARRRHLPLFLL